MEDTEHVKRARQELRDAEKRAGRLKAMLASMEERTKLLTAELRKLVGGPWDRYGGQIQQMRSNLVVAESIQHDVCKRQVVFVLKPARYGSSAVVPPFVVDKVTKALVYIRPEGDTRTWRYKRADGTSATGTEYDGVIDMAATFPEGVENHKP